MFNGITIVEIVFTKMIFKHVELYRGIIINERTVFISNNII